MDRTMKVLAGVGLGAGLMYVLDPARGRVRRARVRDQFARLTREARHAADVVSRDAANRARGLWAEARSVADGKTPDDRTLVERVRAHLGKCVSHPRAITVAANAGTVTVSGPVLADEVNDLLDGVGCVSGVRRVENRLEVHREAGTHAALQGGVTRTGRGLAQQTWSPTLRVVASAVGLGLMGNCLAQRNLASCLLGTLGFGLFLRATTNAPVADAVRQTVVAAPKGRRPQKAMAANGPAKAGR